jgi:2-keto-4-pentenoate hydratase/2-oxohepta-3-ene-1,7-dioic acid hydratase in catechol pathway
MRLASVEIEGEIRCCALCAHELLVLDPDYSLSELLSLGSRVNELWERASQRPSIPLHSARLLPPFTPAGTIIGIGLNFTSFLEDARRLGMAVPKDPLWFARSARCLSGAYDDVWLPADCDDLDYEGELVIVIGRACHLASREEAGRSIAGYTIGNDLTMRRRAAQSMVLGKFFDTHAPVGPVVVTAEEIDNPQDLEIRTYVNGDLRQQASTSEMILDCYEIVQSLSATMILHPGDLIFTGTPSGCGIAQRPPTMLRAGDRVRVEIDGLGAIENQIVALPTTPPWRNLDSPD